MDAFSIGQVRLPDRVVDGDAVVGQQFIELVVAAAVFQQIVDVDLPILAPTTVDGAGSGTLTALSMALKTAALLGLWVVQRLHVTGWVNCGAVGDTLAVDCAVPFAHIAFAAVHRAFFAFGVTASTAFQLRTSKYHILSNIFALFSFVTQKNVSYVCCETERAQIKRSVQHN